MAKKSRRRKKWIVILFITALLLLLAYIFKKDIYKYSYKALKWIERKRHPERFTNVVDYPDTYSVHGIDISKWQDDLDWDQIYAKDIYGDTVFFKFVIIKATEGIWMEDPMYDEFWNESKDAGLIRGAYHYFYPQKNIQQQARNYITSVDLNPGDLPPVIDIEETGGLSKKEIVKNLQLFIAELKKEFKQPPIIYSNADFVNDYLSDDFKSYKFWVAHYYEKKPRIDKNVEWIFWQHSDKGVLAGCREHVDVNVFNGSMKEFKRILIQ